MTRTSLSAPAAAPDRHAHRDQHQRPARRERRRLPDLPGADRPAQRQAGRQAGRPRRADNGGGRADAAVPRQPDLGARPHRRRLHQVVPGQLAGRQRRRRLPAAPAGGGDHRRGAGRLRREQAGRGLPTVPRSPAARRCRRPAHPQRPLPLGLEDRQEEGGDRDLRPDRRHRPRQQEAADQDLLQPGQDDAARLARPAGPVCGLAAARSRSRSACARPA